MRQFDALISSFRLRSLLFDFSGDPNGRRTHCSTEISHLLPFLFRLMKASSPHLFLIPQSENLRAIFNQAACIQTSCKVVNQEHTVFFFYLRPT